MNIYISQLLIVAGIHALAVISPGPDFILVSKLSLSYSRKIGFAGAIGVALGIGVHIAYSILGISALIASSVFLFSLIKILGALYLIYIGIMSFKKSETADTSKAVESSEEEKVTTSPVANPTATPSMNFSRAIKSGFLTNVLNPKATLFILAVFTQVITPTTPKFIQAIYGLEMILATGIWFSIVAFFLSTDYVSRKIQNVKGAIDKITGVVLTALGIKILVE
jgi:RhtB (resistance to homoserine/threonine) family protein